MIPEVLSVASTNLYAYKETKRKQRVASSASHSQDIARRGVHKERVKGIQCHRFPTEKLDSKLQCSAHCKVAPHTLDLLDCVDFNVSRYHVARTSMKQGSDECFKE